LKIPQEDTHIDFRLQIEKIDFEQLYAYEYDKEEGSQKKKNHIINFDCNTKLQVEKMSIYLQKRNKNESPNYFLDPVNINMVTDYFSRGS
jgi:hypothetical protein